MKIATNRWLFLVILFLIIQVSASFFDYQIVFEDNNYLTDGILQVLETDLNNDHHDEILLVGKNDMDREIYLYWLTVDPENKLLTQWKSENLFEERSTIWAVTGKFTAGGNQILAISNSQYYLYQFENNHVNLLKQDKHNLASLHILKNFNGKVLNAASGDIDGDGQTEIVIARIGIVTAKIYNGIVQVWKFKDGLLELVSESDLLGNIRGITAGDIDQDGRAEIFVEEGTKFAPGNMHVLKYDGQNLTEINCTKKIAKGPVYGMQIKVFPDGMRLVTATATGFINFFNWDKNALSPVDKEINLARDLMSIAVINTNGDDFPELIVAGYPQDLLILAKESNDPRPKNE